MVEQQDDKLSKVEHVKRASRGLAGTIAETLADPAQSHFGEDDLQLIKHHGSYQQDDRDLRVERKRAGLDKAWMFMVRCKMPGGQMGAEQFLALDEVARTWCNGTVRLTSRQGIQFHGIGKENLKSVIEAINKKAELSTQGACGDVNRNVMCDPLAKLDWRAGLGMDILARKIAEHFAPRSTSYWEIWCDGEKHGEKVTPNRGETIYGEVYLPRKFKMAVAVPENNSVHLYTQDIGIEAVHEGGELRGYDLIIGGGMGFSHGQEATYPRLGSRFVRVQPDEIIEVLETIVGIQRDFGDRTERRHARFKYVVEERGVEWVRQELFRRLGRTLPEAGPTPQYRIDDMLGWRKAIDGKWMVGLYVLNGRLRDPMLAGLRAVLERFKPGVVVTPAADLVLTGISDADRPALEAMLAEHGLQPGDRVPMLRRLATACVALPTCGLALAESERYMPDLLRDLETMGDGDAPVQILMTGCPNSCVRTPTGEIAVVGRGPNRYAIYAGGSQEGIRLAKLIHEKVDAANVAGVIHGMLEAWRAATGGGAPFGDWAAGMEPAALAGQSGN